MKRFAAAALALAALSLAMATGRGAAQAPARQQTAVAIFAAGCFWCVEADFDKVEGVLSTTSGYTGGSEPNPTYGQVSSGATGHTEAVAIVYDPAKVSYRALLEHFWRNVDPFAKDRQFCDSGRQYSSGIFYSTEEEDYHQEFYLKNSARYKFYRWNCGRDQRLQELWGKASS